MDQAATPPCDSFPGICADNTLDLRLPSPPCSPLPLALALALDGDFAEERPQTQGSPSIRGASSARSLTSSSGSSEFSYERAGSTTAATDAETLEPGRTLTCTSESYVLVADRCSSHSARGDASSKPPNVHPIGRMVGSAALGPSPIRRVRISDQTSGLVYLDAVYRWPESHMATENIGSMIQAFYQFAREVNSGEVVSVSFEAPCQGPKHHLCSAEDDAALPGAMTLLCLAERGAVFSLFFDSDGTCTVENEDGSRSTLEPDIDIDENAMMRSVLLSIKASFLGAFGEALESTRTRLGALRTDFPESHWGELNASAEAGMRAPLEAFRSEVVDAAVHGCMPPQGRS